jgi:ATP/ADP translocase
MRLYLAILGVQLGLLAAAWFYQPELRTTAILGILLCITLFIGVTLRATRWMAAALVLPILLLIALLVMQFLEWSPA